MTAPNPTVALPEAPLPAGMEPIGTCSVVVDEEKELVCGVTAEVEVLVRNDFGLFSAPICTQHRVEHTTFYKVVNRQRRNRRRRPRGE